MGDGQPWPWQKKTDNRQQRIGRPLPLQRHIRGNCQPQQCSHVTHQRHLSCLCQGSFKTPTLWSSKSHTGRLSLLAAWCHSPLCSSIALMLQARGQQPPVSFSMDTLQRLKQETTATLDLHRPAHTRRQRVKVTALVGRNALFRGLSKELGTENSRPCGAQITLTGCWTVHITAAPSQNHQQLQSTLRPRAKHALALHAADLSWHLLSPAAPAARRPQDETSAARRPEQPAAQAADTCCCPAVDSPDAALCTAGRGWLHPGSRCCP